MLVSDTFCAEMAYFLMYCSCSVSRCYSVEIEN